MGYGQNVSYFFDNSLVTVLLLMVRLLWLVFIVAIVAGLAEEAKRRQWDKLLLSFVHQINGNHSPETPSCTACGHKLASEWKYCPGCSLSIKSKDPVEKVEEAPRVESEIIQSDDVNVLFENNFTADVQSQISDVQASVPEEESSENNPDKQQPANNDKQSQKTSQKSRRRKPSVDGKPRS